MLVFRISIFTLSTICIASRGYHDFDTDYWWDQDRDRARIFNDDGPATINLFPFVVSIVYKNPNRASDSFKCAGVNVGVQQDDRRAVIITSGTCVYQFIKQGIGPEQVRIRSNIEYWDCPCGITKEYTAYQWLVHKNYQEHVIPFDGAISINDIALIALDGPWRGFYNKLAFESPLSLEPVYPTENLSAIVVGWGYTDKQNATQSDLRVARDMTIISSDNCRKYYYPEFFPDNSFCIGSLETRGKGPCSGDHGGPVLYTTAPPLHYTQYNLLGLISTAPRCGDPNKPTIVLNITYYTDFITNLSWINEPTEAPPTDSTDVTVSTDTTDSDRPDNPIDPAPSYRCTKDPGGYMRCCRGRRGRCVVWLPGGNNIKWSWKPRDSNRDAEGGEFQGGWGGFDTAPWGADNL